ncbi:centromere protein S [Latimeria chalumnae]|uniref:Centromere protein S n=1 Tax=Latimeria chalumnae TaxID=7897 RepID=H3AYL3_LATCH|nr:PREDICTED: centromere protein S [Latimeria chalumnae]|eukprot:XP_006001358.1 PREDICTED: centromere protein S [Latimeria chalumnae]
MEGRSEEELFAYTQRLKAAVHYSVGCLCEEVAEDGEVQFNKQTIAAIAETTFRQCENFAKDLQMFARHAKRSTVNTDDVKLLARRSKSLLKYISEKHEELVSNNQEKKKKKPAAAGKGKKKPDVPAESVVEDDDEDSNMA